MREIEMRALKLTLAEKLTVGKLKRDQVIGSYRLPKWSCEVSQASANSPWPVELRLAKDRRALNVVFDDGASFDLSAELLRVTSPSAEVQGHSESERKTIGGKRKVGILSVDPVGNYAVRLGFDDMHTTGIFSWAFLYEIGRDAERRFQSYLDDLAAKGLDRDNPGIR